MASGDSNSSDNNLCTSREFNYITVAHVMSGHLVRELELTVSVLPSEYPGLYSDKALA